MWSTGLPTERFDKFNTEADLMKYLDEDEAATILGHPPETNAVLPTKDGRPDELEESAGDHQAIDLGVIEEMDVFVGICSVCEHGLLQDTLVQCGTCTNAVCPGCSEDGTCQRCMLARSRQQKRKAVDDAQEALAKRMVRDSDNRLQPLQVGDNVRVPVDRVDRGRADPP